MVCIWAFITQVITIYKDPKDICLFATNSSISDNKTRWKSSMVNGESPLVMGKILAKHSLASKQGVD